jgi:protease PrsW
VASTPIIIEILIIAALGILPPILWLLFWLREDRHPEPRRKIVWVFIAGMVAVGAALLLENFFLSINTTLKKIFFYGTGSFQMINLLGFAFLEELVKMGAAFFTVIKTKFFDEPEDGIIYLVTAALGFAALENVLFISGALKTGLGQSLIVSSFRFTNAVLLHASASAIVGAGFAFSFSHKRHRTKELALSILLATALHAAYNFLIIKNIANPIGQFSATALVMGGAIIALILFERARRIHTEHLNGAETLVVQ